MKRLLALGAGGDCPLVLAENNRLTIALPRPAGRKLFEPPAFTRTAANRDSLVKLDAVIALDNPARAAGIIS